MGLIYHLEGSTIDTQTDSHLNKGLLNPRLISSNLIGFKLSNVNGCDHQIVFDDRRGVPRLDRTFDHSSHVTVV